MTAFDRDTALRRVGDRFELEVPAGWRIGGGINGGYVAAVVTRALEQTVADPERHPRSLTLHYLSPCRPGRAELHVTRERQGGSLSTLSAHMTQAGQTVVLALAAFGASRAGVDYQHQTMPAAPPPDEVPCFDFGSGRPWFTRNWEYRPCIGPEPYTAGDEALGGGWIRPVEPRQLDAPLLASITDAWLPSVVPLLPDRGGMLTTVDLTVHFRRALPPAGRRLDDFAFVLFQSRVGAEGYWEEDGAIWCRSGRLLGQVRQLKLFPP